jgi:hypothetical protein
MRVYFKATFDGLGCLKTASTYEEVKTWAETSAHAKDLIARTGFMLIHKVVDYEVFDPNSRPVPNMNKVDTTLIATVRSNYGILSFEEN